MNRKLTAILLCVLVATSVALAACQGGDSTTGPCLAHSDANKDGKCDNCGVQVGLQLNSTAAKPQSIEVTFSVRDDYGEAMAGATIIIQDRSGAVNLTDTLDEQGTFKATLDLGDYNIMLENLPEYHLVGVCSITVEEGMEPVLINVIDNTPNGTPEKPFPVVEEPVTEFFNTNETFTYSVRGGTGKYMVIENAEAEVFYNEKTYTPDADGKITIRILSDDAKDQILFTVTNKAADGQEITVTLLADPGTAENPIEAQLGQIYTAHVVGDKSVYYIWTATADGSLTVTSSSAVNSISLFNLNTSKMEGPTEGAASVTLEGVKAGDVIRIEVTTSVNATEEENDIDFTLTFG